MHYAGKHVSFLTQHGKEALLGSLFTERLGCELIRAVGYDTDQLGTFTRDVNRRGTQLAAARFKAEKPLSFRAVRLAWAVRGHLVQILSAESCLGIPKCSYGLTRV